MSATDDLLHTSGDQLLAAYLAQCDDAEAVQERVLLDIVARARDTEWGREHGFDRITSVADFRASQPLTQWAEVEPHAERMQGGAADVLFPGLAEMFILTSGTTGASKLIPEAEAGELAKKATQDLRIRALVPHLPGLADTGHILTFANRRYFGHTPAGIPYGAASGSNLALAPPLGAERLAYPLWVPELADGEADVDYLILRFALERDVRVIRGNNAGRLASLLRSADERRDQLVDDIRTGAVNCSATIDPELLAAEGIAPNPARADELAAAIAERGRLDAVAAFPNLGALVFWISGSVGRFMNDLGDTVPADAMRWDIGYGSSEGRFNVPLTPGVSAGPLALHAHLYEFLPLDGGEPLLAHEVVDGASYGLVITSYSGLYRYDMHDIVRVEGFTGGSPNIVFESKSGDVANISGEKLQGSAILREVAAMLAEAGLDAQHFCVVTDLDRHGYDLCLELRPGSPQPPADLPSRFKDALSACSPAYDILGDQGLLAPPRVMLMAPGWQEALYQAQIGPGRSRSQVKLRTVELTVPAPDYLIGHAE